MLTLERLSVLLQHVYPGRLLSRIMYRATRIRYRPFKDWQIRWFIRRYRVDMSEASAPDPADYPDFNAFFTRSLRPGARPLEGGPDDPVSPVDGAVSETGTVSAGRLLQAKGRTYRLGALLGDDPELAARLDGGPFATLYLSPRDYHRVHAPLEASLVRMRHVPGARFSVAPSTVRYVPDLFTGNERVVMEFDIDGGPMALVMVGALFVGNVETVWSGPVAPREGGGPSLWTYDGSDGPARTFARGAEVARFNMGSTVILILPPGRVRWTADLEPGSPVRLGQRLGVRG